MTYHYRTRVTPGWAFLLGALLLPAVLAIGATVFVIALVLGLIERAIDKWPTASLFALIIAVLAFVVALAAVR